MGTVEPRPDAAEKWVDHLENDNKAFMYCAVTNITIPSFLQEFEQPNLLRLYNGSNEVVEGLRECLGLSESDQEAAENGGFNQIECNTFLYNLYEVVQE